MYFGSRTACLPHTRIVIDLDRVNFPGVYNYRARKAVLSRDLSPTMKNQQILGSSLALALRYGTVIVPVIGMCR